MKNKLVVRISEGLGNQLFMYANAYSLAKKINYELLIDNVSAYRKLKIRDYLLHKFNISAATSKSTYIHNSFPLYIKHKFRKKIDIFFNKKSFLSEQKDCNKDTFYTPHNLDNLSSKLYLEGYYQSEKYFYDYREEIKKEFSINNISENNLCIDPNIIKKVNSVSIVIRTNRFSENNLNKKNLERSNNFVKNTFEYIKKSINFFKNKLDNPYFFLFSNDFLDFKNIFNEKNIFFIENKNDKAISDFYLSTLCKNFIIGPSTFHWWSAYLSKYLNKICIRPPDNLKFSSNKDIYPDNWINLK